MPNWSEETAGSVSNQSRYDRREKLTVDQGHAHAILTRLANDVEIAVNEVVDVDLKALLDDLGGVLMEGIVLGMSKDMVDSRRLVGRGAVLADVLDAPVAELALADGVNVREHFVDTGALSPFSVVVDDR